MQYYQANLKNFYVHIWLQEIFFIKLLAENYYKLILMYIIIFMQIDPREDKNFVSKLPLSLFDNSMEGIILFKSFILNLSALANKN